MTRGIPLFAADRNDTQHLLYDHATRIALLEQALRIAPQGLTQDDLGNIGGILPDSIPWLRLDTTNAPLTGPLPITADSAVALDVKTAAGVSVWKTDTLANLNYGRLQEKNIVETKYLVVDAGGNGDYTTIQAALNSLQSGHGGQRWDILVRPAVYSEQLSFSTLQTDACIVTIIGLGDKGDVTIDSPTNSTVVEVGPYSALHFKNVTLSTSFNSGWDLLNAGNGGNMILDHCVLYPAPNARLMTQSSTYEFRDCTIWGVVGSGGVASLTARFYNCLIQGAPSGFYGVVSASPGNTIELLAGTRIVNWGTGNDIYNEGVVRVGRALYNTTKTAGAAITILDGDVPTTIPAGSIPLASANILVGNVSNVAAAVAMTGDVTLDNAGVTAIGAGKVTLANMANLAANSLIGNNTGVPATPIALTVAQAQALLDTPSKINTFRNHIESILYGIISPALTWAAAQIFNALATFNAGAAINAALTITANLAGALATINQQGTGDALIIQDGGVTRSRFPDGGGFVAVPQAGGFSVITGLIGYDNSAAGFERLKFQHEGHSRPVPIDPRNAFRQVIISISY